ncbi:sigma factor-like helix-turn-helix DNA-binding protein [Nocardia sp. NPDC057440]|uniref:sigma factor-like helix-turn-helix DNA-binding protein n=1 Tax=Nocardia sp. NPDC057440 TaxID=3346134 RepID=UPI00366FDD52
MSSATTNSATVLREVFDVSYEEIAAAVDKTPATVRQIARRARQHVEARRPRSVVSPDQARAALESFQRALETGDPQGLLNVLAPDVVLLTDGGGIKTAARVPIIGIERVLRNLVGFGKISATLSTEPIVGEADPHRLADSTQLAMSIDKTYGTRRAGVVSLFVSLCR